MRNIKDQQLLYDNAIEKLKSGDFSSGIYSLYKALQIKNEKNEMKLQGIKNAESSRFLFIRRSL